MLTINTQTNKTKVKNTKNLATKENQKPSLLNHLKKVNHSSLLLSKLQELIIKEEFKNYSLKPAELIAVIAMLPKEHHFEALELIEKKLGIQLSYLEIKKLKVHLSKEQDFSKLLSLFSRFSLRKVLFTIKKCNLNVRLEKFKALAKQYKLNFSNSAPLRELFCLFPEQNLLELVKIPEVWAQIKIKFSEVGKRPALPLNQKETLMLLKKLDEIYDFQNSLNQFSVANKSDQINILLRLQAVHPKLLAEYLKTSQNITELFRWIPENSVLTYLELPFIKSAIDKVVFSWIDIVSMLKSIDNEGVYTFSNHLLEKNKITETIDINQLKILLIGLDYEKRLVFFNNLKLKQFISSEINAENVRLVELFSVNLEDQLNNNIPQASPLFFRDKAYKHKFSLPKIEEEYERYESKKLKFG